MVGGWNPTAYLWDSVALTAESVGNSDLLKGTKSTPGKAICQIRGCEVVLESTYYKKYRVCPDHAKSPAVVINGQIVRFCQKCARFHDLCEFDADRRSCRIRLAEHNKRRRQTAIGKKTSSSSPKGNAAPEVSAYGAGGYFRKGQTNPPASDKYLPHSSKCCKPQHASAADHPSSSNDDLSSDMSLTHASDVVAVPSYDCTLDALLAPVASTHHSWDQLSPHLEGKIENVMDVASWAPLQNDPEELLLPPFGSVEDPVVRICSNLSAHHGQEAEAEGSPFVPIDCTHDGNNGRIPGGGGGGDRAWSINDGTETHGFRGADGGGGASPFASKGKDGGDAPVYRSADGVSRLSLKLFSCLPDDLPETLRVELEHALDVTPSIVEGYIRPGCTHVTVEMRVPADVAAGLEHASSLKERVACHHARVGPRKCSRGGGLVQLGNGVVITHDGNVLSSLLVNGPNVPKIERISPTCVALGMQSGEPGSGCVDVDLSGSNIRRAGDLILCRQHGHFVTVEMKDLSVWGLLDTPLDHTAEFSGAESEDSEEDCGGSATSVLEYSLFPNGRTRISSRESSSSFDASGAGSPSHAIAADSLISLRPEDADCVDSVPVRLLGLQYGVAEIEVQKGGVLAHSRPLLVLPDAAAVVEIERIIARTSYPGATWIDAFLRDVGLVIGHLHGKGAAGRAPRSLVSIVAARLVEFCLEQGCVALSRLLQPALAEESACCGSSSLDLHTATQAELSTEVQLPAITQSHHLTGEEFNYDDENIRAELSTISEEEDDEKAQSAPIHLLKRRLNNQGVSKGGGAIDAAQWMKECAAARTEEMLRDLCRHGTHEAEHLAVRWVPAAATLLMTLAAAFLVRLTC